MKFGQLFEFHKIPEWYTEYFMYKEFIIKINDFKTLRSIGKAKLLIGFYMVNKNRKLYCIDFINDFKKET